MSTFTNYLTGIADAIRNKKGTAEPIPAAAFASEINALVIGTGTENDGFFLDLSADFSFIDSFQGDELFEGFAFADYTINVSDIVFN